MRGIISNTKELRDPDLQGKDHWGCLIIPITPPPDFQVPPAVQLGRKISGAGDPSQTESGAAIQELGGASRIRVVSEGSLPPTGRAYPELIVSVGAAREEDNARAREWGVEGLVCLC